MLEDNFIKMNFVNKTIVSDGYGGFETVWNVGAEFQGLATLDSAQVQTLGALRGNLKDSYTVSTYTNVPLQKDQVICFDWNGERKYALITAKLQPNAPIVMQSQWMLFKAETWIPTEQVIG